MCRPGKGGAEVKAAMLAEKADGFCGLSSPVSGARKAAAMIMNSDRPEALLSGAGPDGHLRAAIVKR